MGQLKFQPNLKAGASLQNRLLLIKLGLAIAGTLVLAIILSLIFGKPFFSEAAPPPPPATAISGVINSYAKVDALYDDDDDMIFEVEEIHGAATGFTVGSKILVIQMKGVTISTNNNSSFGAIINYANAGNYEFATVKNIFEVTGEWWEWWFDNYYEITVDNLERNYDESGIVQLVSVPQYENVDVTGDIEPFRWNPDNGYGGIVAMEVSNTLTLNANIDVSGMGFRGGARNSNDDDGGMDGDTYYARSNSGFAQKGEGIATHNRDYARGALANGGGGGNTHNAGGGGGGNFTKGGNGGAGFGANGGEGGSGIGGKALEYDSDDNKIFFGGGGGGGQHNNDLSSDGGNGGGIVIIRAKNLVSDCGGAYNIVADGDTAEDTDGNDGAGGGGAGGTIFLDIQNYNVTCNINISAQGGDGGMVRAADSHGGGGGGGSGAILFSKASTNDLVIVSNDEGTAGPDCNNCTASGEPGGTCVVNCSPSGWTLEVDVIILPVELLSFKGKATEDNKNLLEWETANETNNDFFTIEKSRDGKTFTPLGEVTGSGTKTSLSYYLYVDNHPMAGNNYYRLKQTDFDGKTTTHSIILINNEFYSNPTVKVGPNPFSNTINIEMISNYQEEVEIMILDKNGKIVFKERLKAEEGENNFEISPGSSLSPNIYLLKISSEHTKPTTMKIIKR